MKLAAYNVENLFARAKTMNLETWTKGKPALADYVRLNELIQPATYTAAIKTELLNIMNRHPGLISKGESKFIRLRKNKGEFIKKPTSAPSEITATGRSDWTGWFELQEEPVNEEATRNTARIIGRINADVLCVIEAEDRISLSDFNDQVLKTVGAPTYEHVMLIDGNDRRGIDVGLMTRTNFTITRMLSHVDEKDDKGRIFSRDCAEYEIMTKQGNTLLLLVNHFKSKGYGDARESANKRFRQATKVREIYDARIKAGYQHIAILGDFNETPREPPMQPLLANGSKLTDIMVHPTFTGDGRPGTHGNGTASAKLDYILLSPQLSARVKKGGIERQGVWGGKNGTLFPHIPEITKPAEAASDHAALWAELDL